MKKFLIILLIPVVLAGLLFLFKDQIASSVVTAGFSAVTGAPMKIGSLKLSLSGSTVEARQVTVYNPSSFGDAERLMAAIPVFYLDFDLGSFLKGKVHIRALRLDLETLVVVRNAKAMNIESLKALQPPQGSGKPPEVAIDSVEFSVGKVVYRDYTLGNPLVQEFNVNIREKLTDVTNPYSLVNTMIVRSLGATSLSRIAGINGDDLRETAEKAADSALRKFQGQLDSVLLGK